MRIALIAPFGLRAKGTSRARALPLARELARRGHAVALFAPPYDSPEDARRCWTDSGVEVINLPLPAFGRGTGVWYLALGWRLFRAAAAWQPDVVHVFKPKGPSGLAGMLLWATRRDGDAAARARGAAATHREAIGRPRIIMDSDDWEGDGGWNDDPRSGYSRLQRRFFAWQERYGLSHADAWTVTSECLCQRAIAFGAAPERVFVLHNGITAEPSSIIRRPSSIVGRQSVLIYTRFAGVRPADVGAIWAAVRARVPQAALTVVGRGLAGEEQALCGTPGIMVRGWLEPAEMPAVFAAADLAIVPWADTLPNRARHSAKVLDLMAAGLPIVAYAVGELPATVGEAGVLVPPGDVQAFAGAVAALLADSDRAERFGAAAQARVRVEFTWSRLADVALAAYGQ